MKGFTRTETRFSLCGLNCALCSMHLGGYCPGCGGGAGNQSCAIAKRSLEHGGVSFCWECPEHPCSHYEGFDDGDSFVPHRNRQQDIVQAQELGLEPYLAQLEQKRDILEKLLAHYNDGRRKTFFNTAVYLLPLEDLRSVMTVLGNRPELDEQAVKERALAAVELLQEAADRRGISLSSKPACGPGTAAMRNSGKAALFLRIWREDYVYQTMMSAAVSFGCTALFALYNGYLGVCHGSVWYGSIGIFYLLFMMIRGTVLLTEKKNRTRLEPEQNRCRRRTFLISSILLLMLDLALILPISMMVVLDKPVSIGPIPAIAMATYTTWKITMASIHISRQRRRPSGNILVAELRTVNFIDALVAVLTLQNTLIMVNRTTVRENAMLPVSAASSAVIYVVIVSITARMLWKGLRWTNCRMQK